MTRLPRINILQPRSSYSNQLQQAATRTSSWLTYRRRAGGDENACANTSSTTTSVRYMCCLLAAGTFYWQNWLSFYETIRDVPLTWLATNVTSCRLSFWKAESDQRHWWYMWMDIKPQNRSLEQITAQLGIWVKLLESTRLWKGMERQGSEGGRDGREQRPERVGDEGEGERNRGAEARGDGRSWTHMILLSSVHRIQRLYST